jgi:phosphoribosylformimino-5-aminoimidazole carboxamide ribotide isomerase
MDIIPAIDLKSGKCVRLKQGRDDATTEYSADPVAVAQRWEGEGATRLHVVNLDGAFGRASGHLDVLREIVRQTRLHVQFGGGLRSPEAISEALNAGATKVVLGTYALEHPELLQALLAEVGAEHVIVALDTVKGRVTTHGWTTVTENEVLGVAQQLCERGVREILQTDVSRDGMMTGPDIATLTALSGVGMEVIASGGVSSERDVRTLVNLRQKNLSGVIIGRALYEGAVDLKSLIDNTQSTIHN